MNNSPKSSGQQSQSRSKDQNEDLIVTPINIARARRHASTQGQMVIANPRQQKSSTSTQSVSSSDSGAKPTPPKKKPIGGLHLDGMNTCLLLTFIGLAFLAGGVLGGLIGGGMILWVNDEAIAQNESTPTTWITPTVLPVATATPTPLPPLPTPTPSSEEVIAHIIPSVVTVINRHRTSFSFNEDGRVVGSGVIIDPRGYIATNNHVVENGNELSIILADGREVVAELVKSEPAEDLAVVKINVEGLPAVQWGDSQTVRPGQAVYAIGSPLGDFPSSVSFGVVSGMNRALEMNDHVIDGLIQTDAAINRGSSGGPLINTQGQVIGINTFIIRESEDRGVAEGIAFSIPAERAKSLLIPWIAAHSGDTQPIPASGEANN